MSGALELPQITSNSREKYVRFENVSLEGSPVSEQPLSPKDGQTLHETRRTPVLFKEIIQRGFNGCTQRIRASGESIRAFGDSIRASTFRESIRAFGDSIRESTAGESVRAFGESFTSRMSVTQPGNKLDHGKGGHHQMTIFDPQGSFIQQWNKIFLLCCAISLALDPLFFYIPVIDNMHKCLKLDHHLQITACVFRTLTDLFYIVHMIFQFRTGFIAPYSRVFGRGELVKDPRAIADRYLSANFLIEFLSVLPLPQVAVLCVIPLLSAPSPLATKELLKSVIFLQYVPRIIRVYPLYKEVTKTSGIITETAWAGAAFNLFLYMLASHVVGAFWYLFSIERQDRCWRRACNKYSCDISTLYCGHRSGVADHTFQNDCVLVDPDDITNSTVFNFGMFYPALQSQVVEFSSFPNKFFYCFWWGLRNLSSLGQNLNTSTYVGENLFAVFICIFGLVLFALLIGNMQKYLQSTTVRVEEMRVRKRDTEQWMSHRLLPDYLRERIRRYEQYKWQETRGVEEESLINNLPKDLRRDIKRHLCLALLKRVPMFEKMDEQLMDALCDRLKPVLYTENSFVVREGDPVTEMLFIIRGRLSTETTNGGRTGFFNSVNLDAGDFCGDELLTWALHPHPSTNLPISTRTVQSITEVEAFALMPEDLKFVASQFRRLHSRQLRHTFRFYSQQWRSWAACFIQAAWRRYYRKKLDKSLLEAEGRLQNALTKNDGGSLSFGATIHASRFAANMLKTLRQNSAPCNSRMPQRLPPLINLEKPSEPDFGSEGF